MGTNTNNKDGWTILTADGKPSSFEHDVAFY
jgi:hypothetical protein